MFPSYLGRGDGHLDLTAGGGDDLVELVADALEEAQAVVLGEGVEEVLDGGAAAAGLLDQLGDDSRLVLGAQGRGGEDLVELGVLVDNVAEGGEGLGGRVEGRRLGGGSVLLRVSISPALALFRVPSPQDRPSSMACISEPIGSNSDHQLSCAMASIPAGSRGGFMVDDVRGRWHRCRQRQRPGRGA